MVDKASDNAARYIVPPTKMTLESIPQPSSSFATFPTQVGKSVSDDILYKPTLSTTSDSASAITLADLPTEILQIVVDYLWIKREYFRWYDRFEARSDYSSQQSRLKGRKEVLAFSSCSKYLRKLLFQDSMLKEVTVKLEEKELSKLAALPDDLRRCVR